MPHTRKIRFFRSGRNQAIRIPVEFELPGKTALMHREGNRLIIEGNPARKTGLLELLESLEPLEEDFPDFDTGLPLTENPPE